MQFVPTRWSIDFWPMRLIVSIYLLSTAAMVAAYIMFAGVLVETGRLLSAMAAKRLPAVASTASVGPPAVAYKIAALTILALFAIATVAMWLKLRSRWIPAFILSLPAALAWWVLAYANFVGPSPPAPSPAGALTFAALVAVVTLGSMLAIVHRAPPGADADP